MSDFEVQHLLIDIIFDATISIVGPQEPVFKNTEISVFVNWYKKYEELFEKCNPFGTFLYINEQTKIDINKHSFCNIFKGVNFHKPLKEFEFPHYKAESYSNPTWQFVYELFLRLHSSPLTGFIALKHILSFHPKKVYITGWDLYEEGNYNLHMGRPMRGIHDIEKHKEYLKDLVIHDPRIILEEKLKRRIGL